MRPEPFRVERFGIPIEDYPLKDSIDTGIEMSNAMAEYDACIAARLDILKWEQGIYPTYLKANILEWYRKSRLIKQHQGDAQARASEKKARKSRRRR